MDGYFCRLLCVCGRVAYGSVVRNSMGESNIIDMSSTALVRGCVIYRMGFANTRRLETGMGISSCSMDIGSTALVRGCVISPDVCFCSHKVMGGRDRFTASLSG